MITKIIGCVLAMLGGVLMFTYRAYAEQRGFPIGSVWLKKPHWLFGIAVSTFFYGFLGLFFLIKWYFVILSVVGVFFIAPFFLEIFKSYTQLLSYLIILSALVIYCI